MSILNRENCGRLGFVLAAALAVGCGSAREGTYYSSTQQAFMARNLPFSEGKLIATQEAENKARDQVLLQAMNRTFPNGVTLEDAAVADPFLRAKVYDLIRSARIADQTIKRDEGEVTVTVSLDMAPINGILKDPKYLPEPVAPVKDMPTRSEGPPKVIIP